MPNIKSTKKGLIEKSSGKKIVSPLDTNESKKRHGIEDSLKKLSVRSKDRLALLVDNAVKIARLHKENCNDKDCGCSLFLLGQLCIAAGVTLTDEQFHIFI